MAMRRLAFVATASVLFGCSYVNAPNANELYPFGPPGLEPDAGIDAGADASLPAARVEDCAAPGDEDGDGLSDCADFACQGELACCLEGEPLFVERWQSADLGALWSPLPSADPIFPTVSDARLTSFGSDEPHGIMRRACVPLLGGADISFEVEAMGCDTGPCVGEAALVLSPAHDALPGRFPDHDLAVRVTPSGELKITQAGEIIGTASLSVGAPETLHVAITPGVDDRGAPVLFATVTLVGARDVLTRFPMVEQDALVDDVDPCRDAPGLYLGVVGAGSGVSVGELSAASRQCVNPSHFRGGGGAIATLTSEVLGLDPSWAGGGIGSPSLVASMSADGQNLRWDVAMEGTNDAPELERTAHVGYAIGHARNVHGPASSWSVDPDAWGRPLGSALEPRVGEDPPSCALEDCASPPTSARDPHLYAERFSGAREGQIDRLYLTFAREWAIADGRDRFALYAGLPLGLVPSAGALGVAPSPQVAPDDVPAGRCTSLRDPALVSTSPAHDGGYWLFFTCEREGAPSVVLAALLSHQFTLVRVASAPALEPSMLGAYAAGGVRGAEPLVDFGPDGRALVRLWFVARDARGEPTIALAQGETTAAELEGALPLFAPYPANPVLRAGASALGPCDGVCTLESLAVTRHADEAVWVRLLVTRRVAPTDGGRRVELLPLDQLWSLP
jgi:hypothetical protein